MVEALRMMVKRKDPLSESEMCTVPAELLYRIMRAREEAYKDANQSYWQTPDDETMNRAIRGIWALEPSFASTSASRRRRVR